LQKMKFWIRAIRPHTLSATIIPVTMGAVLVIKEGVFHWGYLLLSLITMILIQSAVNLINDHDDYINKVDTKESLGSSRVVAEEKLTAKELYIVGSILVAVAFVLGVIISAQRGWFIFVIGLCGIALVYSYTGKPLRLKYRGLGFIIIFIVFGPLALMGSYYVQALTLSREALILSIPIGMLTTAILQANDLRDMQHDKLAGIKTLSIIIGKERGETVYRGLILLPYAFLIAMIFFDTLPNWSVMVFLTLPSANSNIKTFSNPGKMTSNIIELDKKTAQLQAQFGVLLIASVLL